MGPYCKVLLDFTNVHKFCRYNCFGLWKKKKHYHVRLFELAGL